MESFKSIRNAILPTVERWNETMTDPIAFRPTEKADTIINDYMKAHINLKKSDAVNEIIEGRLSLSLSPLTPQTPTTPTPLNHAELTKRAKECLINIPLDVYNEIYEVCVQTYKVWLFNQSPIMKEAQLINPLAAYSMNLPRSTP